MSGDEGTSGNLQDALLRRTGVNSLGCFAGGTIGGRLDEPR